ncbi:alpha/beta fold hydrolase [Sorangium sp. So ce726]|uniref:alpha/beta hydrolase n=1 Tax=Sorangium sp. So ce726 TaxID=3133319 RepID=UPI003F6149C3
MIWLPVVLALLAVVWGVLWRRSRFPWVKSPGRPQQRGRGGVVRTVHFPAVDGTKLEGWLFLPDDVHAPPVVLMAPGLGGTKDGFLEEFAWAFVERGLAVLAFDYRCFGGSEGFPRHWVAPPRHREDYEAAIAFVQRDLGESVDSSRIALWGSSFSGGTALVTAARRDDVRAVVAQCPYLKTPPRLEPRGLSMARFVFLATLDMLGVFPPVYVPLFGRPGEWAFATSVENPSVAGLDGPLGSDFWRLLPKPPLGGWENRMLARGLATLDESVPMNELDKVKCSVLFVAAHRDDMVPRAYVEEAHARLQDRSELAGYDCGHFDLYVGPVHAENARRQADFLARELRSRGGN